ncbi:YcaO-like family protein [Ligilactobacillus agilis]|uniref:YcaO-like family protein n=1 Tax=Ligilactobacillus agilis TaxID=1601 RepID=UPI003F8CD18B
MKISIINSCDISHNYLETYETYKAYEELERYYGPYELFTKVTTYFRSVSELPSYIGKGVYSNIDYILQKIVHRDSFNPELTKSLFGGGKGNNFSKILISTLGEMFERILGSFAYYEDKENFLFGSYKELSKEYNLLNPKELQIFAKEQLKNNAVFYQEFTIESQLRWVRGKKWISGNEIWVPAQLVYLFFPFEKSGEDKIGYSTSGGLSLHDNEFLALYHGITECIERDQINLRWYNKIPPERINYDQLEGLSLYGKNILSEAKKTNKNISSQYHNMDMHDFPVITTISYDNSLDKFSFCAGGGLGDDLIESVESSFKEYGQSELNLKLLFYNPNWYSSRSMIELFGFEPEEFDVHNIRLFYEIVPYYGLKDTRHKLDWYIKDGVEYKIRETKGRASDGEGVFKSILGTYQIDPIIFDFTPEDFKYIKLMKSFIPELTQAFLPNYPCLGHKRFYEVAYKNGYSDKILSYKELNTEPLPFP